jgi:hypothetical protein
VAPTDAGRKDNPLPEKMPEPATPAAAEPKYDPLNLSNLRLSQDFLQTGGSKKLLTTIPLMKPPPQSFIRVHASPAFRGEFAVLELKDERETFLVTAKMIGELSGEIHPVTIYTAITKQGVLFAWPIRLPGPDGRDNPYWVSAREAAAKAMTEWVRVKSNQFLRAYEIYVPDSKFPDPDWPAINFQEIIRLVGKNTPPIEQPRPPRGQTVAGRGMMSKPKSLATVRRTRRRLTRKLEKLSLLDLIQARTEETKQAISDLQQKTANATRKIGRVA